MFPSKTLLSLVLITLSAVAASPLNRHTGKAILSFTARINERSTGGLNVAEKDRARAQSKIQAGHLGKRDGSVVVANTDVQYTAEIGIGTPPTSYTLLIDTGSSNTWVGAGKAYVTTSSSHATGDSVSVAYGSGSFSGDEWVDTVTLASGLVIDGQSIGVASTATGFNDVDGILGVGPVGLTSGTVSNTGDVPTVSDNLFGQGTISEEVLGVYYVPASPTSAVQSEGTLTFGGYDSTAVVGEVTYTPLTTTPPASLYWGIDQSISYGTKTILSTTAGIVDTGTTLILIATDAFDAYKSATGATSDATTGLLTISPANYVQLQSLWFNIEGKSFEITANAQTWPRSLNSLIGGSSASIYLIVSDIGSNSGSGLDFINGYTFLERYYSVYDTTNNRVGFGETDFTFAVTN